MAEYYQFAHSVQGYNHIKANKVCQDASGECHFEDVALLLWQTVTAAITIFAQTVAVNLRFLRL